MARTSELSPDKLEFIATVKSTFGEQTVLSKEDLSKLDYVPYWVKSKKYPFTNSDKTAFDLSPLLNVSTPIQPSNDYTTICPKSEYASCNLKLSQST